MNLTPNFQELPWSPDDIGRGAVGEHRRILLLGEPGSGKSTLAGHLASGLDPRRGPVRCIDADLGSPSFGPPGVVALGEWGSDGWRLLEYEPVCSLDAARFRLPLVQAVAKLARQLDDGVLLVDTPGVVRGMAGAELFTGLIDAAHADAVIALHLGTIPLAEELAACGCPVFLVRVPTKPRKINAAVRARRRTRAWNHFLADGVPIEMPLAGMRMLGGPPPEATPDAWRGRQVAFRCGGRWTGFGEVLELAADKLAARVVGTVQGAEHLLMRDAARDTNNELRTAKATAPPLARAKQSSREPMEVRCGPVVTNLVNGVTGDPLLMVRLRFRRGTLLFDVGEAQSLSRRVLHTVTDVFLSHAHLDHVAGFTYLLRSRLSAALPALRVYGPPGTRAHVAGFLDGVLWDRIGDDGPVFEITEVHDARAEHSRLQAGRTHDGPITRSDHAGELLRTADLTVSVVCLDHATPVLGYSVQITEQYNVDGNRLTELGLAPGAWLGDLKANVRHAALDTPVRLPNGETVATKTLADQLLRRTAGPKVVYATDLADHPDNRRRLIEFAAGAQLMFCEAPFRVEDGALAERTQHLTTLACGEIARTANVERLVPFHFSKRYEGNLGPVYEEIREACGAVVVTSHAP